jgi:hypothetical protein
VVLASSFVLLCLVLIVRVASPMLRDYASSAASWLVNCIGGLARCHQAKAPKSAGRQSGSTAMQQQPARTV